MYFIFLVFQCKSLVYSRNRCPLIRVNNGRVKLRSGGRIARITCNWPFRLVHGIDILTCVGGEWDYDTPICASKFNKNIF